MYRSSTKRTPLSEGVRDKGQKGEQRQLAKVSEEQQPDRFTPTHTHIYTYQTY